MEGAVSGGVWLNLPSGGVFEVVVFGAEVGEVVGGGGAAVGPVEGVVEFAGGGAAAAAGEPAGLVVDGEDGAEFCGGSVAAAGHGADLPGVGGGECA